MQYSIFYQRESLFEHRQVEFSNTGKLGFYEIKINRSVRDLNSPLWFNRYRGKNYDEMLKENMTNKEYLQRVSRENIMLRGLIRKQGNRVLNRLGEKEAEERHELERAERMRLTKSAKPRLCWCHVKLCSCLFFNTKSACGFNGITMSLLIRVYIYRFIINRLYFGWERLIFGFVFVFLQKI